ncbi:DUF1853 family protein [Pseudomonas sp. Marseille-QA0892]
MTIFSSLAEIIDDLTSPTVRDLAWVLTAPPLLHSIEEQRHPLIASVWAEQPTSMRDWLTALDQAPAALDTYLAGRFTGRLGHYYEALWQFAVRSAHGVDLLATNLAIRDGNRTLGEMDMVYRDGDGVHHVEFAVKLYLGPERGDGTDVHAWHGTDITDRLGIKLTRLRDRQLKLSSSEAGLAALRTMTSEPIRSSLWLGGYLFYPAGMCCSPPKLAHPAHQRGSWMRYGDFALQADPAMWRLIPRQRWLAPALPALTEALPDRFSDWKAEFPTPAPAKLLARLDPSTGIEMERVMLVDDAWHGASAQASSD